MRLTGMAFHVFRHVETDQIDSQCESELFCHFGLAHPGRPGEEEGANRFVGLAQTGTCHLDAGRQCVDSGILTENHAFQIAIQILQFASGRPD